MVYGVVMEELVLCCLGNVEHGMGKGIVTFLMMGSLLHNASGFLIKVAVMW